MSAAICEAEANEDPEVAALIRATLCPPTGQTAKGDLVYSRDCKAIKADYTVGEYKPNMPDTNMKDTVIPKPGGVQQPDTTPTKGETR